MVYVGNIVAGSTFGIPADVDLGAPSLSLSKGGLMLGKALQTYGAIWRGSGGTKSFAAVSMPSEANNAVVAEMIADFDKLMPYMSILRNQASGSVNGGGPSTAPPAPSLVLPSFP